MTKKSTFLSLTVLTLNSQAVTAFSVSRCSVKSNSRLAYKNTPDEDLSYQNRFNGTVLYYDDFEIRESEQTSPRSDLTASAPKAIEPRSKGEFISPIQMIKLVPKVTPVTSSSVFFVAPVMDLPTTTTDEPSSTQSINQPSSTAQAPVKTSASSMKPKWSPSNKPFNSNSYLSSLSPTTPDSTQDEDRALLNSLKAQQGAIREDKLLSTQAAMYKATRRTSPKEAIANRIKKGEEMRKLKEAEMVEKRLEERSARLQEKQRLERERIATRERYARQLAEVDKVKSEKEKEYLQGEVKRGIPVFTSQSTLLVGGTISLTDEDMNGQRKTLEVAQALHRDHINVQDGGGKEGASPIVAVIDQYTDNKGDKRFATLAAVETMEENGRSVVNLMGVGRVYLHNYFSTRDAGMTKEEELNDVLHQIQDRKDEDAVVMAEFDLLLDNSIVNSSSESKESSVSELYQTANKVYRLHEERKRLASGLRAGQIRLNSINTENEVIAYDDWSDSHPAMLQYGFGYGLFSTIPDLTKELMSRLETYYSPSHREREEYEAEVASFAALRALEEYASPEELAAALVMPCAKERLYMAYGIMSRHREELLVLVEKMNNDLGDCGEECSDLL